MAVNFKTLLDKNIDEIKRPPAWPAGTYYGQVKRYELAESRNKKTPYIRFFVNATSAGEDVDPELLDGIDLTKKELYSDFYLTAEADFRLKAFLISCLGEDACSGRLLAALVPEVINCPVILSVTRRASEDGKDIFNDVSAIKGRSAE